MCVSVCVCVCNVRTFVCVCVYVCSNLQQHHCKSLQYHKNFLKCFSFKKQIRWISQNVSNKLKSPSDTLTCDLPLHHWHKYEVHNHHSHYSSAYACYKRSPQRNSVKVQDCNNMKTHKILLVCFIFCIHSHTTECWCVHHTEPSD